MVDEQGSTKTVLKLTLFWFAQNMAVSPLEEVFMRRIVAVVFFVFVVNQAQAGQVWDIMQFQVQPGQAAEALQAFEGSEFFRDQFGEEFVKMYCRAKFAEEENYHSEVSDRDYGWCLRTV